MTFRVAEGRRERKGRGGERKRQARASRFGNVLTRGLLQIRRVARDAVAVMENDRRRKRGKRDSRPRVDNAGK